jgi:hypothetical protein
MRELPPELRRVENIDPSVVFLDTEGNTVLTMNEVGGNARPRKGETVEIDTKLYRVFRVKWKLTGLGLRQYVLMERIYA